jgi:uncharacterized protein (UPF0332 family)
MTIDINDRMNLIRYRISQSKEIIEEITFLLKHKKFSNTANRIYYGIFYSLTALALFYKFETSKHLQLIGWFNKSFIKENIFEIRYGLILKEAYEFRQQGDYEPYIEYNENDINDLFDKMKDFINKIEEHINKNIDCVL